MDFFESLKNWWSEKVNSPLYLTYLFFLITWNWKHFQIIFLESPDKFASPRIEYLNQISAIYGHKFIDPVLVGLWQVVPPLIFTFIAIIYFPRIHAWAHGIHVSNYFDRKKVYYRAQLEYEKEKTKFLQSQVEQKQIQRSEREKLDRFATKEEKLLEEIESVLANPKNTIAIRAMHEAVYAKHGKYKTDSMDMFNEATYIPSDILSRLDSLGAVHIDNRSMSISPTDKGKAFIKYLQEKGEL